jgi:hypothetical protein
VEEMMCPDCGKPFAAEPVDGEPNRCQFVGCRCVKEMFDLPEAVGTVGVRGGLMFFVRKKIGDTTETFDVKVGFDNWVTAEFRDTTGRLYRYKLCKNGNFAPEGFIMANPRKHYSGTPGTEGHMRFLLAETLSGPQIDEVPKAARDNPAYPAAQ